MANFIFHSVTYPNNDPTYIVANSYAKSLWGGSSSELKTFFTSSLQTKGSISSSNAYYYEVWASASLTCNDERMFSIAYGHIAGSGSAYLDPIDTTSGDAPSKSIFSQFKLMCLDGDEEGFLLSGSTTPLEHIYAISINRDKFGNRIDPGNFQLNLVGLTKQVNGLANAARSGKLRPDDTTDGTFTLTNIGTFGSIMGTPIINQPQVAIMAVGVIKKRPMVIETLLGDSIAIRHMMYISLSYDHRIIDGSLGSIFLNAVSKELEEFDINRSF